MKIRKGEEVFWEKVKRNNQDPYGKAVIDCVEKVGNFLDRGLSPELAWDMGIHDSGITGFQAGGIVSILSQVHPRGEEFRKWWNIENQIKDEGEKANKKGSVLNPALLEIDEKKIEEN